MNRSVPSGRAGAVTGLGGLGALDHYGTVAAAPCETTPARVPASRWRADRGPLR